MIKNEVSRISKNIPDARNSKKNISLNEKSDLIRSGNKKQQSKSNCRLQLRTNAKKIKRPYVKYREALILNEMINIKFYSEALSESMGRIMDHKKEIEDYENGI